MIETNLNPICSRHNFAVTERSIKRILRDGTPAWVSRPRDFKSWARELYLRDKEASTRQVAGYRIEGQEALSDEKARKIHPMRTWDFVLKLRANGVKCFTYQVQSESTPDAMINTVALWCVIPGQESHPGGFLYQGNRFQYVTWMDIPAMYEWSVLRLDEHELPIGEKFRGWRTVVSEMVRHRVVTEPKAHRIFGLPTGPQSLFYRKRLQIYRQGYAK